eukprot:9259926-Alexandrium_andersonii.AAC.1
MCRRGVRELLQLRPAWQPVTNTLDSDSGGLSGAAKPGGAITAQRQGWPMGAVAVAGRKPLSAN